ncbi:MAG: proteinase inhibitor [Deltaproteobacteria bacterium]|nr:proteinase inhibitor [Deltaproteobacteria bacterium]
MLSRLALFPLLGAAALVSASVGACGEDASKDGTTGGESGAGGNSQAVGSCSYTNAFSKGTECKLYSGSAWTAETAKDDCAVPAPGATGTFSDGATCDLASTLGTCLVDPGDGLAYTLAFEGSDAAGCEGAKMGCEVFAKGSFTPSAICGGSAGSGGSSSSGGGFGTDPFVQPYQVCKEPLAGEPAGKSAGGKVCTWTLISGATEEGRRYDDYASCDDVLTQRPYYGSTPAGSTAANDPRLADSSYMAEVEWSRAQVRATACICCHSSESAPSGAAQWNADDTKGIWLDGISDSGIAIMAGLADSSAFGTFSPAENNGFDRATTGVPTTDVVRMQKLFLGEWKRRGFTDADAKKLEAFGGPLVDQQKYIPTACKNGEGVSGGKVTWSGGPARYVYILEEGSANPTVPPNLDEPTGTIWLADVPTKGAPFASGLTYGELTGDMKQRLPASGKPAALTPGKTYYLTVLRDIALPLARCLFQAK